MAIPKMLGAQRDFSGGELDEAIKRADELPVMKIGARQLANWRILNGGQITNRPGRSALFRENGRVDKVLMSPGNVFYLAFGNGYLRVYNATGTQVFASSVKGDSVTAIPWTSATIRNIVWAVATGVPPFSVYICYGDDVPNNVPQVLSWDGISQTSMWSLSTFAFAIASASQKRAPFYRISPHNITMRPSAAVGNITITFSANVLVPGMIGTLMEYAGRQFQVTGVSSGTVGTATVIEALPPSQNVALGGGSGTFALGDVVEGSVSGASGIMVFVPNTQQINSASATQFFQVGDTMTGGTSGATGVVGFVGFVAGHYFYDVSLTTGTLFTGVETVTGGSLSGGSFVISSVVGGTAIVQLLPSSTGFVRAFTTSDLFVGPTASFAITGVSNNTPQAISDWDDEVINNFRGWPRSVFFDQTRLGFTNFPQLPSGIAWSAIDNTTDFYAQQALPDNAIFELAPGKSQVLFVQPGMESSEFIFCDNAVYHIPITASIPLVPGSVSFDLLSTEGCLANVQPRAAEQSIVYIKSGGIKVAAVQTPGAYYRPHIIDDVSEMHSHLFTAAVPIAIAIPAGPDQFEERYAYILLANGNLVVGKFAVRQGLLEPGAEGKPKIGWLPWNGVGASTWISAQGGDLILTTAYAPNGVTPVSIVERLDNAQYVDSALSVNSLPAPFTPPGGKGPLFKFPGPNSTVTLMDQSTRMMGTYQVDANGFIVPQFTGGENLSSLQLVAGQPWTATFEPFIADAPPGQDSHQRMFKRRVCRMMIYVSNSTGFLMARLFAGPIMPTSPPLGTIMNIRRVPTWNIGDDPTQPPPLREEVERWRPRGRAFDPRVAVIKDTPGPLLVHEVGTETTI
jgi:hypothetical protein